MNADILKPYLAELAAAYPGEEVSVGLLLQQGRDGKPNPAQNSAYMTVGGRYYWGESIQQVDAKVKSGTTKENLKRLEFARKLRDQADRIANGTDPIPAIEQPAA